MKYAIHDYHKNRDGKTSPTDEYYTKLEEVEFIFDIFIIKDELKDKIIYCPADGEESNFVKYLIQHKDDIQYKELIYTSDDMMTHEDLFQKADYIITNPPFSMLRKHLLPLLKRNNCKFFLFGSFINNRFYLETYSPLECKYIRRGNFSFITPFVGDLSGTNDVYVASTIYLTNMNIRETGDNLSKEIMPSKKFLTKSLDEIPNIYALDEDSPYLIIDRIENYPKDYYEPVWATISAFQYKYTKYFDYIDIRDKNGGIKWFVSKCSDNKNRFLRVLVKRKKDI